MESFKFNLYIVILISFHGNGMNLISNFNTALCYRTSLRDQLLQINGQVDRLYLNEKPLERILSEEDTERTMSEKLEWNEVFRPTFHLEENKTEIDFKYPVPLSYPTLGISFNLRIKQAINRGELKKIQFL